MIRESELIYRKEQSFALRLRLLVALSMVWIVPVSTPLIIGSVYGLIPGGITVILLIIRTSLEDKLLRSELNGYVEYTKRVRYRLLPGFW